MSYRFWVFLHIAGVFGFLVAHGVSITVSLRLRRERDVARLNALLDVSARTTGALYWSLGLLLIGAFGATSSGKLWGFGWPWAALLLLAIVTLAMIFMAKPYYQKVRFVTRAVSEGSQAVTGEQLDKMLTSARPLTIMGIGFVGLGLILTLMIFKPALGMAPKQIPVAVSGPEVRIAAAGSKFTVAELRAPAGEAFSLVFNNRDGGVPHNIAVYGDRGLTKKIAVGETFPGPGTRVLKIRALDAGRYFFRCDVHPAMNGILVVE